MTILLDFLRTFVGKSLRSLDELRQLQPMHFKAGYNPADEEDSFAISTYKKNELLRAERQRLSLELSTMQGELLSLRDQLTSQKAENEILERKVKQLEERQEQQEA